MFSGRVTPTSRQRHCKSRNVRRKRCCAGNAAGPVTSNLPKPYSEFPKICQMVPMVLLVIPSVPGGGGSDTAATGQPTASSSDSASGEISFFTIGSAIPKAEAAIALGERTDLCSGAPDIGSDDLLCERDAHRVEIYMPRHRNDIARLHSAYQHE